MFFCLMQLKGRMEPTLRQRWAPHHRVHPPMALSRLETAWAISPRKSWGRKCLTYGRERDVNVKDGAVCRALKGWVRQTVIAFADIKEPLH